MIMDANWFLSACAQTSGAIVAIVGGFVATRLVSMSAERSGQASRLKEIGRSLAVVKLDETAARASLDRFDECRLRAAAMRECVHTATQAPEPETLRAHTIGLQGDLPIDRVLAVVSRARDDAQAALAFLDPLVPRDYNGTLEQLIDRTALERSGIAEDALEASYRWLSAVHRLVPIYDNVVEIAAREQVEAQKRLSLEARWRDLAGAARNLEAIEREVEGSLARIGRASGIGPLLWPLAHLATWGILCPLALLLVNGGSLCVCFPAAVLSLFAIGVVWVIVALAREARSLDSSAVLKEHYETMRKWQAEHRIPWGAEK